MATESMQASEPLPNEWLDVFFRAASYVHQYTVPFYAIHNSSLVLERTGVLFRCAGMGFVLTAAHDLHESIENNLPPLLGFSSKTQMPIPLFGATVHYTESNNVQGVRDIAAIRLSDDQQQELSSHWKYLTMADLNLENPNRAGFALALGYPTAWSSSEGWNNPEPLPYLCNFITPSSENYESELHIGLSFDRESVHLDANTNSHSEELLPKVQGISGCGVWKIVPPKLQLNQWNEKHVRLIGIQHRCKHDEYLIATQARWVVNRLASDYPEIESASQISYRRGY